MNDFRFKLAQFFQGRTGVDSIGRFCSWTALILMLVTMITHSTVVYLIAMIFLGYSFWRMLSKNYQKRYYENQKFLSLTAPIRNIFQKLRFNVKKLLSKAKYDSQQRKIYAIFYCPKCKQKLRAPKGRGKIQVTCNNCRNVFIKRV